MRFSVSLNFQSLKAVENGGASVRRGNSELIRVSLSKSAFRIIADNTYFNDDKTSS